MKGFINDLWWIFLLHGIAMVLFGVISIAWPGLTFGALSIAFAVYILVSGILNLLAGLGSIQEWKGWFLPVLLGIIEIAAGVYVLKTPGLVLTVFMTTVGFTFIIQGVLSIVDAIANMRPSGLQFFSIITGVIAIIAGFIVLQNPVEGGISFAWALGVYGLVGGTVTIAKALNWRIVTDEIEKDVKNLKTALR